MKEAWVYLDEWSKEMVTTALEGGADAIVVPPGLHGGVKALGRIATVSEDGDLKPGKDVFFEPLRNAEDEARIMRIAQSSPVVIEDTPPTGASPADSGPRLQPDSDPARLPWPIIPLENLVARGGRLLVPVSSVAEVDVALGILEQGVTGVVIHAHSESDLRQLLSRVKVARKALNLQTARIVAIYPVGMGDRACIDTCTLMQEGEGVLVGNSSAFLFLVQAETKENPYVAPRPFRVNAGAVHAYVQVPEGRTLYLSELQAGHRVMVVNACGEAQEAAVGRIKIERRPLLLVTAELQGMLGSIVLQNAETIRLTGPGGEARSVVELKPGDPVQVLVEKAGRHFGMRVDESIQEK